MHNIHCLNIVHISYGIFNSELQPNANKDPWRPIPPPESLVLVCIFTFISAYFSALSADKVPMETPVHIFTPLFSNLEADPQKISKYINQQQDRQTEEVRGDAGEPKEGMEQSRNGSVSKQLQGPMCLRKFPMTGDAKAGRGQYHSSQHIVKYQGASLAFGTAAGQRQE